jgi:hypothetical protein
MKSLELLNLAVLIPVLVLKPFVFTAEHSVDQSGGITAWQLAIGILVFGLYVANHYRSRIRDVLRSIFSRGQRSPGTEDQSG